MPAPKRSFRATDEIWKKIGQVAERCGMTRSQLLRRSGTRALERSALPLVRHYLRECLLTLIKMRETASPYAFAEDGEIAEDHRFDGVIEVLYGVSDVLYEGSIADIEVANLSGRLEQQVTQLRAMRRAAEKSAEIGFE